MNKKILILIFWLISAVMSAQLSLINVGTGPNTGNGDPLRTAFQKTNLAITQVNTNTTNIALRLIITDTTAMLSKYLLKTDTIHYQTKINLKVNITDTATMLAPYLLKHPIDSLGTVGSSVGFYDSSGDTINPYIPVGSRVNLTGTVVLVADSMASRTDGAANKYASANQLKVANKVGFTIIFDPAAVAAPTDNTLYYYGAFCQASMTGTVYARRYLMPVNCTLIGYSACTKSSAAASNETSTLSIRINNTTDVQLSNALVYTNGINCYSSMALSTDLTAGDYIEMKLLTATWGTDATSIGLCTTLFFVTR
jgi:hypothetical protein